MTLQYDRRTDVLYISFIDSDESCEYVETDQEIVLRIGAASGRVHGCTIPFFQARSKESGIKIDALGEIQLDSAVAA